MRKPHQCTESPQLQRLAPRGQDLLTRPWPCHRGQSHFVSGPPSPLALYWTLPGTLPLETRPRLTAVLRVAGQGLQRTDCLPAPAQQGFLSAPPGLLDSLLARIRLAPTLDQGRAIYIRESPVSSFQFFPGTPGTIVFPIKKISPAPLRQPLF